MGGLQTTVPASPDQNHYQNAAASVGAIAVGTALTFPGAIVGAVAAAALWHLTRTPHSIRVLTAAVGLGVLATAGPSLVIGWPWRLAFSLASGVPLIWSGSAIAHSVMVEAALGPTLALLVMVSRALWYHTILGQAQAAHDDMTRKAKALQRNWKGPARPSNSPAGEVIVDPPGKIRLGVDEASRYFDLSANELAQHVFIPGASGYGKTTTLIRLANGALRNGYAVAIIDCKGSSLGEAARRLAASNGLPFSVVDPVDANTLGYDPCTGDPSHIANKLIGAFSFGPEAEIYKNVAMEVVPVIARAIQAQGDKVTISAIYHALGKSGLVQLARTQQGDLKERLLELGDAGGVGKDGYSGLQSRLGALMEGRFGPLFEKKPALDWRQVSQAPSVTYIALSATAAGEDVELFGRVIAQDLKQLCDDRLRNPPDVPLMVIFDEFAALREAEQIVDLLLQARQALMPVVITTQYLPQEPTIRLPALQSGVLITHRLGHDDAEQIANELGTHTTPFVTQQIDFETGTMEKGTNRNIDEYNIHPNVIRTLPIGLAVVYSRPTERRNIVHILRDQL